MADQIFMFMTTAGTMAALAALLFVSEGLRARSSGVTPPSSISSASSDNDKKDTMRQVERLKNIALMENQSMRTKDISLCKYKVEALGTITSTRIL